MCLKFGSHACLSCLMRLLKTDELPATAHHQAAVRNVEYDFIGFRVICILDELQRHHVVAFQPGQVALDVAEEVGGVRATCSGPG